MPAYVPELTPESAQPAPEPPRPALSPAQSAALLATLEQLAGENIRLEDTGVEWRLLGEDNDSAPNDDAGFTGVKPVAAAGVNGADAEILEISFRGPGPVFPALAATSAEGANAPHGEDFTSDVFADTNAPIDSGVFRAPKASRVDELLDDAPTPVDELLSDAPNDVEAAEVFDGHGAAEVEAEDVFAAAEARPEDLLRFDDNTGLPDNFDLDAAPPAPVPAAHHEALHLAGVPRDEGPAVEAAAAPEIVFGEPDEWGDLLEEVEPVPANEPAAEREYFADTGMHIDLGDAAGGGGAASGHALSLAEELAALPDDYDDEAPDEASDEDAPGDDPAPGDTSASRRSAAELALELSGIYAVPAPPEATAATGDRLLDDEDEDEDEDDAAAVGAELGAAQGESLAEPRGAPQSEETATAHAVGEAMAGLPATAARDTAGHAGFERAGDDSAADDAWTDEARADEARPDKARHDEARPDKARPDKARAGNSGGGESGDDGLDADLLEADIDATPDWSLALVADDESDEAPAAAGAAAIPASTGELEFELAEARRLDPDAPEFDPTRTIVPPPTAEEQTVNMLIDQDLMRLALTDDDGMTSTMVLEAKAARKRAADGPDDADAVAANAGGEPLFETIIMEGGFARTAFEQERLAAEARARLANDDRVAAGADPAVRRPAASGRKRRLQYGLIACVVALVLLLAGQFVHQSRAELATIPAVGDAITPLYRAAGAPITPEWNVKAWRFEVTRGSTQAGNHAGNAASPEGDTPVTGDGLPANVPGAEVLTIRSRLGNTSGEALPYPLITVALTDRFEEVIGSRVLEPAEYLEDGASAGAMVPPGGGFDAVIAVAAPAENAAGFKLNVCYRQAGADLRCAIEDFR
ncbi:MAG TPA: DUF3426 domain-containing protein [Woeseiaceae bacterium]|nr:DUF3426 domain-containing protein [Woeseiaceae bacterium]